MVLDFVLGTLIGYVAHQTEPWVRRTFGNGWRQMVSYVIGVLIAYPVALISFIHFVDIENQERRFTLSWFVSFFSVGLGTLIGWVFFGGDANGE